MDDKKVEEILARHHFRDSALLAILQDIQDEVNYLPKEAVEYISRRLEIPRSRIYSMATFFRAFSLEPRGKYICNVCMGTACHVRGAERLVEELERKLEIKRGETTSDMKFTLETVNCVGACALGPVVVMNKEYHGNMTTAKLDKMLKQYKGESGDAAD